MEYPRPVGRGGTSERVTIFFFPPLSLVQCEMGLLLWVHVVLCTYPIKVSTSGTQDRGDSACAPRGASNG